MAKGSEDMQTWITGSPWFLGMYNLARKKLDLKWAGTVEQSLWSDMNVKCAFATYCVISEGYLKSPYLMVIGNKQRQPC